MPDQHKPTLQTVADEVGVSRTTVSNAYNRPGELTDELRTRILETAERLGYPGPDPAARNLRTGSTETIGVVFTESLSEAFRDATSVALLRGIAAASENTDVSLLLLPVGTSAGPETSSIRNASVDGFILYSMPEQSPAVEAVKARRLPTVTVDEPQLGGRAAGHIGIDDEGAAYAIASHVLDLGHRSVAVLAGRTGQPAEPGPVDEAQRTGTASRVLVDRFKGYERAFADHDLAWKDVVLYQAGANNPGAARRAAAALLAAHRPTAVLAANDQLALAVINEAAYRGIDVPGQLSVAGFDDVPRASVATPALTTVRQPLVEKGRLALRMLRDEALGTIELPTEVVIRSSTRPVDEKQEMTA